MKTSKIIALVGTGLAVTVGAIFGVRYLKKVKTNEGVKKDSTKPKDSNSVIHINPTQVKQENEKVEKPPLLHFNKTVAKEKKAKQQASDLKRINEISKYVLDNFEFKSKDDAKWYFSALREYKETIRKLIHKHSKDFIHVPSELLGRALSKLGLVIFEGSIKQRLTLKQAYDIFIKYIPLDTNGKNPYIEYHGGFDEPTLSVFPKEKLEELATNGYWLSLIKEEQYHKDSSARTLFKKYAAGWQLFNEQYSNHRGYLFNGEYYVCVIADVDAIVKYGSFATALVYARKQYRGDIYYHTKPEPTPKPKDFSKLNNVAIIYPSPDGFRWQYIDMSIEAANKFVNHDGYYRTDQPKHYFTSAIGGKRYRYALDFCKGRSNRSHKAIMVRFNNYYLYLKNNGVTVIVAKNSSDYINKSKQIVSNI